MRFEPLAGQWVGGVADDVDRAARLALPGTLELAAVVGTAHRGVVRGGGVVDDHVAGPGEAGDHDEVPGCGADRRAPRSWPLENEIEAASGMPRR
jgi:hypothetical protein